MNYIQEILDIETEVATKLDSGQAIPAVDLRFCFNKLTLFLKKTSPLASGTFPIGDVSGSDEIRTVILPYDVGTSNYRVEGSLVSKGANYNNDNDAFETIKDKTGTSFKLCLREVSSNAQDLDFEWAIYPKN
ncbi:MAG: hypothetical protein RLZZ540_283 [Bacteroidota bacterium]|jgi:hypothetical protein